MCVYSNYYYLNFRSFIGTHGDSYDRFLIRMNEMAESLNICTQIINKIKNKELININLKKINFNKHLLNDYIRNKENSYTHMEDLIKHFKK